MNLYLLTQDVNRGYDTYDACVVAAENEESARMVLPGGRDWEEEKRIGCYEWARSPSQVKVTLIGETSLFREPTLILASFNAG